MYFTLHFIRNARYRMSDRWNAHYRKRLLCGGANGKDVVCRVLAKKHQANFTHTFHFLPSADTQLRRGTRHILSLSSTPGPAHGKGGAPRKFWISGCDYKKN